MPLFALLRRRLSDDEVRAVADQLHALDAAPVNTIDIQVAITKANDELPAPEDVDRVRQRLIDGGWPVNGNL